MPSSRNAVETTTAPAVRAPRWRRGFGLVAALSALVVSTVACTALIIHLSWSWTAQQNVADVVDQWNAQIAGSLRRELQGLVAAALSLQEAVRAIFAEGALMTTEPEKRAVLLLSLLRSQPGVSWVSLGLPDGGFVGAQKQGEHEIDLVEVERRGAPTLHVDHYGESEDGMMWRAGRERRRQQHGRTPARCVPGARTPSAS